MSTRPIRLFAVTSVPEGKAAVQRILGELEGLPDSVSEEIELVGLAFNRRGAIQQMSRVQPDVLLVDLMLTGLRSIEIISEASAKLPDMKILALAPSDPPHDLVILALQAGATGYFTTDTEVRETATAIRQALNGKNYLPVDETFEIMRQAAPELLVSAKERRANLIDSLLAHEARAPNAR
jgi:DNA-binding NarL/FixJ family response regulator